jgi:hypothetical protein
MARKVLIYVVLAVIAVNLAIVAVVFTGGNAPAARPLPNPNGYDDFVKAGENMTGNVDDYETMSKEELTALVATNAEALKLMRAGLGMPCLVPVEYLTNYSAVLVSNVTSFRQLGMLLRAQGRLAELEGRTNDAADIYLEADKFGQESARGGLLISRLVGAGCEKMALNSLGSLTDGLGAQKCREAGKALEETDFGEEPIQTTFNREKLLNHKMFGLRSVIVTLFMHKEIRQNQERAITVMQMMQHSRRDVMLAFAARAYELEKGKKPQSVSDLVPEYLKSVPKDPMTGKDMGLGH